jgi:hypothetical protein
MAKALLDNPFLFTVFMLSTRGCRAYIDASAPHSGTYGLLQDGGSNFVAILLHPVAFGAWVCCSSP